MERKTPATQVQEALTLIGRLFVQETDRVDAVNRELRRDLDGTCLTLRQTEDAAQAKLDAAMEMLEASRRECNEYREKAFRLQNAVDSLRTRLQASEMRGYELERQLEECAPYASKYPVLLAAYKMVCRDVSAE